MSIFSLSGIELSRFRRSRLTKAALVVVATVPALYGGLYLTANWDPVGHLDNLSAAVVDEDQPATVTASDGSTSTLDAGSDLVSRLTSSDDSGFTWVETSAVEASEGLADGTFAATITVPAGFSADIASVGGDAPEQAKLTVTTDDATNYIVGSVTTTIASALRQQLQSSVTDDYLDNIYTAFTSIHDELGTASDGATQLSTGLDTLDESTSALPAQTRELADGAASAEDGSATLAAGATAVASGATQAATGATSLSSGASSLAAGADSLAGGTAQVSTGAGQVSQGATSVSDGLASLAAGYAVLTDAQRIAAIDALAAGAAETASGASAVATGASTSADGAASLSAGADQVSDGTASLATSLGTLSDGAVSVSSGASALDAGLGTLVDGTEALATGSTTLASGVSSLRTGADSLSAGLASGVAEVPSYTDTQRANLAAVAADPIDLVRVHDNAVDYYGEGLAPYFIPLALWVGGIVTYLVLRALSPRALASTARSVRVALGGLGQGVLFATLQALVLLGILVLAVGLRSPHLPAVFAFTVLVAITFTSIHQALVALLGGIGRLVALVLLMLQLTSAGGTYPVGTSPGFFSAISPFLPMTYAVDGLRRLIAGGDTSYVWTPVLALLLTLVLAVSLSVFAAHRRRMWTVGKLHPALVI